METLYQILGVDEHSSHHEIKRAYRQKARVLHPDVGGDEDEFKRVQHAFETLNNTVSRRSYDASIRASVASPLSYRRRDTPIYDNLIYQQNVQRREAEEERMRQEYENQAKWFDEAKARLNDYRNGDVEHPLANSQGLLKETFSNNLFRISAFASFFLALSAMLSISSNPSFFSAMSKYVGIGVLGILIFSWLASLVDVYMQYHPKRLKWLYIVLSAMAGLSVTPIIIGMYQGAVIG